MKTRSRLFPLLASLLLVAADAIAAQPAGYLFVTYRGERSPEEEQIHFGLSKDGREWTALNAGAPVLVSGVGEGGVRDPFLLRSHDGAKFYLLATDLAVHRNRDWKRAMRTGSRSIVIWESSDLVNWSAPRLAPVAHELSGCAWAPEAIYDPEKKAYLVYWASTLSTDGFSKHSVWASYTRDFVTFDAPLPFIEKSGNFGDPAVISAGHAYYRFARDNESKSILMETAPRLGGPWRHVGFSLGVEAGIDSPACFPLSMSTDGVPSAWALLLSDSRRGYRAYVAGNLAEGMFFPLEGSRFPFRFQQGSVLPLRAEEYERLQTAYSR
jgi:hypothetical protein